MRPSLKPVRKPVRRAMPANARPGAVRAGLVVESESPVRLLPGGTFRFTAPRVSWAAGAFMDGGFAGFIPV